MRLLALALALLCLAVPAAAEPLSPADYAADARSINSLVNANYAYLDRFPGGRMPISAKLQAEAGAVIDARQLTRYAERALALLADHHAITGSSMKDSWAVFPSYGDLWVDRRGADYVIGQVRAGSPAEQAGIRAGDRLVAVDGTDTAGAVAAFWTDLGTTGGGDRDGYAARVLVAGRRDRPRRLTVQSASAAPRTLQLPNLYALAKVERPPLTVASAGGEYRIRFNDSLGVSATIAAFDAAMAAAPRGMTVVIDLRDTPSGGNTSIARAVMSWFVTRPTFYQVHNLPAEERETGIARQWAEQVLPRPGKYHRGPVTVRVGRWTGSMGEGLAIGFDAIGARVEGSAMAGLLGAVYDYRLERSGQIVKLPTERLYSLSGTPRERFVPKWPVR
ncbi:MAG: PDZ domain-containing protein [Sphingomicrobium sp.]